jgi:hypothetical protein
MRKSTGIAVILSVAMIAATSIHAKLLVHEGFDGEKYTVGADLEGLAGGKGFGGSWTSSEGVSGKVVAGLSLGNLAVSGQAGSIHRGDAFNQLRFMHRELAVGAESGTVWMSYLVKWTEDNGGKGHSADVGVGTQGHQDDSDLKLHSKALTVNEENRFAVGYSDQDYQAAKTSNTKGKVYLVVARWTKVGEKGEAKLWLFDSADAVNKILGTDEEAKLDGAAVDTATRGASGTASFESGEFLKVGGFIGGGPGAYTITIDELRIADAQADVLPEAKK